MIVPITTATIARTSPTARVRRKRAPLTGATAPDEAEGVAPRAGFAPTVLAASEVPRRRPRPGPAFMAALLTLPRQGG